MENRRRQPKQRVLSPVNKGGMKTTEPEIFEGYNMYPDLQNVWKRNAFQNPRVNGNCLKFGLIVFGITLSICLTYQNIWLLQDYTERTKPIEIRTKEVIMKESLSTRDYINYAADFNKAKIVAKETTPTYQKPFFSFVKQKNAPEFALSDINSPGHCWAFQGDIGHITVILNEDIYPRHFSIIHASLADHDTAPKHFCIYSVLPKSIEELGCYNLDLDSELNDFKQTFPCLSNCETPTRKFRLEIKSNYGAELTCLYQLQIHGDPSSLTL